MTLIRDKITGRVLPTHGLSQTYEYNIWGNMLYRCNTPTSSHYNRYGAKGIKVSDSWHTFQNFILDMGTRPSIEHSIDRIDNNGNYCKENCRWATKKEQAINRSNTRQFIVKGETLTLEELSIYLGLTTDTIKNRLRRHWDLERILNTPKQNYKG